jgi:hypothetical protein
MVTITINLLFSTLTLTPTPPYIFTLCITHVIAFAATTSASSFLPQFFISTFHHLGHNYHCCCHWHLHYHYHYHYHLYYHDISFSSPSLPPAFFITCFTLYITIYTNMRWHFIFYSYTSIISIITNEESSHGYSMYNLFNRLRWKDNRWW